LPARSAAACALGRRGSLAQPKPKPQVVGQGKPLARGLERGAMPLGQFGRRAQVSGCAGGLPGQGGQLGQLVVGFHLAIHGAT
jgi:hypothetical protein